MKISKQEPGKFLVWWGPPHKALRLDFNPFRERLENFRPYTLCHYQAAPRPLRRFGFYDSETDIYYSVASDEVKYQGPATNQLLTIPEERYKTVPTAVLVHLNSRCIVGDAGESLIIATNT